MHASSVGALAVMVVTLFFPRGACAFSDDFAAPLSSGWDPPRTHEPGSSVTAPFPDLGATDGQAVELLFPGATSPDHSGPGYATELQTAATNGFGLYEARLRTPRASRRTGLVAAFFTYFNDGADHDGDGITDNHEIDFEFLAAEPTTIYMTVWTEYEETGGVETFRKTTRKVDLRTGRVWQTPAGGEGSYDLVEVAPLLWTARRYRASRAYHAYRFAWDAGAVEYSIDLEDGMGFRTLWRLEGVANETIPSIPAPLFFNVWHNATHWDSGETAVVPRRDESFRIDSVSIN